MDIDAEAKKLAKRIKNHTCKSEHWDTEIVRYIKQFAQRIEKEARQECAEIAHSYGRKVYGNGGNKVRDVCHEIGEKIDGDVKW